MNHPRQSEIGESVINFFKNLFLLPALVAGLGVSLNDGANPQTFTNLE